MSEEMKEIRVSASAVRRSLNELAIALACVVLSGLLIFVTSRTSAGAANFDKIIFGISCAATVWCGWLTVKAVLSRKNAKICYDDDGFTQVSYNKKVKKYRYEDIARVTYIPERDRADIEIKNGEKIPLTLDLAGARDFYHLLREKADGCGYAVM